MWSTWKEILKSTTLKLYNWPHVASWSFFLFSVSLYSTCVLPNACRRLIVYLEEITATITTCNSYSSKIGSYSIMIKILFVGCLIFTITMILLLAKIIIDDAYCVSLCSDVIIWTHFLSDSVTSHWLQMI